MAKGKYHEWLTNEGRLKLEAWARDGLNDEQIAHNMGIAVSTLYIWKDKFLEISESLKRGKEVVDIEVENALYKKAVGYEVTEIKKEQNEFGEKKIVETTKHIQPDTAAAIFWLKNRRPDKWKDKPMEISREAENDGFIEAMKDTDVWK